MNEASARIRINALLAKAGWRFFADASGPANIRLEHGVAIKPADLDALGDDFERTERGWVDFLLLDDRGFPLVVLEAKSEGKSPLVGKEQARKYARSLNCRFVMLSNGNLHYFWDLERGNPHLITAFPTPGSVGAFRKFVPNPQRLVDEPVGADYIVLTQRPQYASEAAWRNDAERPGYVRAHGLRFLRDYQLRAVHALQQAVQHGSDRFLFEMATGTGKTLVAAAVIKLFLRTGNAARVLFLVDRLELEDQAARRAFGPYLSNDFDTVVYKERRSDWRSAHIVVTTVQALLFNNKYQTLFSPTDFDLVISDEAHRSIGGNARAVFDYFVGYKLGLTATPRDYLRGFDGAARLVHDPREAERRLLLDTYRTFGCDSGQPTFRYSLLDGVRDGHLVNPTVIDARTEVTTQLLADDGFTVSFTDDTGSEHEETFRQREFEKRFFADATNQVFCKTFLENAVRGPGQRRDRHRGVAEPRRQADADPQCHGRCHVSGPLPVRLRRAGHLARCRRSAVHHQLCQQQPDGFGQLPGRLSHRQGAGVRHRRHDDHRLRLHRHPQHRPVPAHLLAHRLRADQGPRNPPAHLHRTMPRCQPSPRG